MRMPRAFLPREASRSVRAAIFSRSLVAAGMGSPLEDDVEAAGALHPVDLALVLELRRVGGRLLRAEQVGRLAQRLDRFGLGDVGLLVNQGGQAGVELDADVAGPAGEGEGRLGERLLEVVGERSEE